MILERLRKHVKRWQPAHRRFRALAAGIRATLRQGRKAKARAEKRQDAVAFHEWRKHIKALWYDLRLVEGCSPLISQDVAALHRAESSLGDDHNIALLLGELSKGAPSGLGNLRRAARRHQAELRRQAVADTKRIYDAAPRDYVRRVKRSWKIWRRRDQAVRIPQPQREAA